MKINSSAVLKYVICTTSMALGAGAVAARPRYSITDLGTLGGKSSYALAINDMGQVVGSSNTAEKYDGGLQATHAFLRQDGKMTDLGTLPNAFESTAYDINNKGQVLVSTSSKPPVKIGWDMSGYSFLGCFIWHNGNKTPLPFDEPPATEHGRRRGLISVEQSFRHINDKGEVVDYRYAGLNNKGQKVMNTLIQSPKLPGGWIRAYARAVFYDGDKKVMLPTLGGEEVSAGGMNDKGEIVGDSTTRKKQSRAFLWRKGKMKNLGILPGFVSSHAYAINNRGQIIGRVQTDKDQRPVVWLSGKLYDLNTLIAPNSGWNLALVADINDKGQIAGTGLIKGALHAFLLTPIAASNLKK